MTVDLTKLLEQYRAGDRGLATYAELQALEKQLAEQAARIAKLELRDLYVQSCLV